jgi:anti-sigma B factor antagonist
MGESTIQPLRLTVREVGSVAVVGVRGSAGMEAADKLRVKLEELAVKEVPIIVLDLKDMDFICSLGLGAIISGHLKCRHHNGQIRLVNPQPAVLQLLETTRLTKLFPIYTSVDDAVRA